MLKACLRELVTVGRGSGAAAPGGRVKRVAIWGEGEYFKCKKLIFVLNKFTIIEPNRRNFDKWL
jgi:hypothetical protein